VTIDSAEHPLSDDVTPVTETWEADADTVAVAPAAKSPEVLAGKDEDSDLEIATALRSDPWRLSHLMIAVAVIAVGMWMVITLQWLIVVCLVLIGFAMILGLGFILARLRASRQDALLGILAIAAERGMPMAAAVAAFADQFGGRARGRVKKVVALLNAGSLLPEALQETPRAVARDAILMAWIGQVTGRLSHALRLAESVRSAQLSLWMAISSRLAYLLGLMLAGQGVLAYLLLWYHPTLQVIFRDFGFRLPEATLTLTRMATKLVEYAPISVLVIVAELLLLFYIPFSFAGWMNYKVPLFDRLLIRRHTAMVLRALSVVVAADQPIAVGLSTLANHYPTKWIRRRLTRVEKDVRLGADWMAALWRAGLLRKPDVEVLGSAASVGNLSWALGELAETCERRLALRIQAVVQTLFPLAVVMIGLAIGLFAISYFLPLVEIIGELAEP
jgi:type II secretory pathway component PulF